MWLSWAAVQRARPRRRISRDSASECMLLDRAGRIKPCGGAIPPKLIEEFEISEELLVARVHSARMVSPAQDAVDMPIEGGYVGMVDRETFDEWLRQRARSAGAELIRGDFRETDTRCGRRRRRAL